jgi:hypothetical protein
VKTTLSYFEHQERKKLPKTSEYVPLPQDVVPFIPEEPTIHVKHTSIHPREFAKLFPGFARPRSITRK